MSYLLHESYCFTQCVTCGKFKISVFIILRIINHTILAGDHIRGWRDLVDEMLGCKMDGMLHTAGFRHMSKKTTLKGRHLQNAMLFGFPALVIEVLLNLAKAGRIDSSTIGCEPPNLPLKIKALDHANQDFGLIYCIVSAFQRCERQLDLLEIPIARLLRWSVDVVSSDGHKWLA